MNDQNGSIDGQAIRSLKREETEGRPTVKETGRRAQHVVVYNSIFKIAFSGSN